jgi:hypothetical protein
MNLKAEGVLIMAASTPRRGQQVIPAQLRVTGAMLLLAGMLPLAGVVNPALWKTFSGTNQEALQAVADHPVSTQVSGFLIGAGFAAAIPAVAALARVLDTQAARLAVPLFAAGAGLALADIAFGLKVSYDLAIRSSNMPVPSWYEPMNEWGDALFTAGTGLLGAAALLACGCEILRRRALARWSGWITVVAAVAMLAQVAAFGGLLPFPQFLTFLALGAAVLLRSRRGQAAAISKAESSG